MRKILVVIILQLLCLGLYAESATERVVGYKEAVIEILTDQEKYQNFRQNRLIKGVFEHVNIPLANEFYSQIRKKYPDLLNMGQCFAKNDSVGHPLLVNYEGFGLISPTTLRYVFILGEIQELFDLPKDSKIVEIGAGCGGQCAVISRVVDFLSYELIDLDYALPLIDRYLNDLEVDRFITYNMKECGKSNEYDLCISNYAFSECDKNVQKEYIKKVLSKSKRGYVIYNYTGTKSSGNTFSVKEVCALLQAEGLDPQVKNETIQTNPFARKNPKRGNKLIYWGSDK
ncbi:MAG: hypothetical protein S4CHLAM20_11290 [Chlamydiia bacterium]|nr:hypothetical protein [Chlamydiia bacterium]